MADATNVVRSIGGVVRYIKDFKNSNARSLPERAQPASIVSKLFIDDTVAEEDIMLDLIGALNQLYVAYIFAALGMESYVDSARTVKDISKLVSTEAFLDDSVDKLYRELGDNLVPTMEQNVQPGSEPARGKSGEFSASSVQLEKSEQRLIAGRVVEVGVTNQAGTTSNVRIMMQLVPRIISSDIAEAFLSMNVPPSVRHRFKQVMAGEIRFMKDFVLAMDQIREHRERLKQDRTGDFKEMLSKQNNSLLKYWNNILRIEPNYNSASSVLIMDKQTFKKALSDSGIDKFDEKARAQFFSKSFMMMMAVIDTDYNTVDLYLNGIKGVGQYSFNEIEKVGSSKGQGLSLKDVMSVFGRGNNINL